MKRIFKAASPKEISNRPQPNWKSTKCYIYLNAAIDFLNTLDPKIALQAKIVVVCGYFVVIYPTKEII